MTTKHKFTIEEPRALGGQLGVNQSLVEFAEFRRELKLELEHGVSAPEANSDAPLTGQISRNSQMLTRAGLTRSQSGSVPDSAKGEGVIGWTATQRTSDKRHLQIRSQH
jgi:hypothetical protein